MVSLVALSFYVPNAKAVDIGGEYRFNGVFTEWGVETSDFTAVFAFPVNATPYRFDLNGSFVRTWASGVPTYTPCNATNPFYYNTTANATSFTFDLGYNASRVLYTVEGQNETFNLIVPFTSEYWSTYTITVVDYLGLDWGYLEMTLPINGTETVIERWDINSVSDLPFYMVWGKTYGLRLVCDRGTYVYPTFTAGATTVKNLSVTADMFYTPDPDETTLSFSATRDTTSGLVSLTYSNPFTDTQNVTIYIYQYNNATPVWSSTFGAVDSVSTFYPYADAQEYLAIFVVNSTSLGHVSKTIVLPPLAEVSPHPFAILRMFGTLPFDPANIPAVAVLLIIACVISWYHLVYGLVLEVIVTAILVYFNFLSIAWSWVGVVAAIGLLLAFSEQKTKEIG